MYNRIISGGQGMRTAFTHRVRLIAKKEAEELGKARVAVLGLGAAGAYAAEALCRYGIGGLTLADAGCLGKEDLYTHPFAFRSYEGLSRVEAGKRYLNSIDDSLLINTYEMRYGKETADMFDLGGFSCIVDALESPEGKQELYRRACIKRIPVVSMMIGETRPQSGEFFLDGIMKTGYGEMIKQLDENQKKFARKNVRILCTRKKLFAGKKKNVSREKENHQEKAEGWDPGFSGMAGFLAAAEAVRSILAVK